MTDRIIKLSQCSDRLMLIRVKAEPVVFGTDTSLYAYNKC